MINDKLDGLIAEAMKNHENEKLEVLRLIKTKFMEYKTAKAGNVLNEQTEATILLKMISQREDSIRQYIGGNRPELAEQEKKEIGIIQEFAPKQASDEDIEQFTGATITAYKLTKEDGYVISMKDMKPIMEIVKSEYPTANGKVVSKVLNNYINGK